MEKKVLIIDDEQDLCLLLKSFLLQQNYLVFTAHSLNEGLRMVGEVCPDILIMDNNLPDGLGWDKLNLIQAQIPECRVILISAFNSKYDQTSSKVSILEKPVSLLKLQSYLI